MMLIVETTGDFGIVDGYRRASVPKNRPAVMYESALIRQQIDIGQLRVLARDLPDDASDEDFKKFWEGSDGKADLAIASFMSQFKPAPAPTKAPAPAPAALKRGRKAAAPKKEAE